MHNEGTIAASQTHVLALSPATFWGKKASFFEVLTGCKHLAEEGWGLLNQEQGQDLVPAECRGALCKMDGEHPRQSEYWGLRLLPPGSDG